jgi:hypothetical protein
MKNLLITYDILKHIRKDWNGISPITKIIPNKKRELNKKKCRQKIDF